MSNSMPIDNPSAVIQNIFIKQSTQYIRIDVSTILWVEAKGTNIQMATLYGTHLLSTNLGRFYNRFKPMGLIRCHRSFLVNVHQMLAFDMGKVYFERGENLQTIPIGRAYKEAFFDSVPIIHLD